MFLGNTVNSANSAFLGARMNGAINCKQSTRTCTCGLMDNGLYKRLPTSIFNTNMVFVIPGLIINAISVDRMLTFCLHN